ncbi:MAG: hypothetical protein Q8P44_03615, partial [Dehalococcoidia bacterium]|nr:hypothetical protein [Dehalococcoidia bacterium]
MASAEKQRSPMLTDISRDEMQELINQGYVCAVCDGLLTIAWGGSIGINSHVLRCGVAILHEGITRHDKKFQKRKKEFYGNMETTSLMAMDEKTMLQRVEMARFPQELTKSDKVLLSQVAITYGFDPLMGEVSIYQGRPYVSIDGRYRKAQDTGLLDGVDTRPATGAEREQWEIPDGDYFFRSEVYVKGASRPFVGWGRVFKAETIVPAGKTAYLPVQKNPQRQCEKRAEAQALRKAFHIPLPSVEDIGSPDTEPEVIQARVVEPATSENSDCFDNDTENKKIAKKLESQTASKIAKKAPAKAKAVVDTAP